jgi:hypothetical protein
MGALVGFIIGYYLGTKDGRQRLAGVAGDRAKDLIDRRAKAA